jgi:putative transposase
MAAWPHAPIHQLTDRGAYIVTAGTYRKHHLFAGAERLTLLHDTLLELAPRYGWRLQAWAVFSNHYHFVAMSPEHPHTLRDLVGHLHSDTARRINALDDAAGRRVWFNYWDTHLTYERSYWTRLQYVHENPVHHGWVQNAVRYRWCSADWFEASADVPFFRMVSALKTDRITVRDDFDVERED